MRPFLSECCSIEGSLAEPECLSHLNVDDVEGVASIQRGDVKINNQIVDMFTPSIDRVRDKIVFVIPVLSCLSFSGDPKLSFS